MQEITWQAPSHIHTEKSSDWYIIVVIVSITLAIIAFILGNVLFGILIIIGSFTLCLHASKEPKMINIKLNTRGLYINDSLVRYEDLESFWVEEEELYPRILFKQHKLLSTHLVVILEEINPSEVREFLKNYLVEEKMSEPFLEKLLIYFGF
jgi:hypothetical protein